MPHIHILLFLMIFVLMCQVLIEYCFLYYAFDSLSSAVLCALKLTLFEEYGGGTVMP